MENLKDNSNRIKSPNLNPDGFEPHWGISASALKWIALITMFLDHFCAVYLIDFFYQGSWGDQTVFKAAFNAPENLLISLAYTVLRFLGRIAFPLYCYMIVEGFFYTRSKWKYALRLFVLAILSEIPFDYGIYKSIFSLKSQNVFFTLLIGLAVIWGMDSVNRIEKIKNKKALIFLLEVAIAMAGFGLAYYLKSDYGFKGVIAIVLIYYTKMLEKWKTAAMASLCFALGTFLSICTGDRGLNKILLSLIVLVAIFVALNSPWTNVSSILVACLFLISFNFSEAGAIMAVFPVYFYNGKKGWNNKWFFYLFYPAHLGLLILARFLWGFK